MEQRMGNMLQRNLEKSKSQPKMDSEPERLFKKKVMQKKVKKNNLMSGLRRGTVLDGRSLGLKNQYIQSITKISKMIVIGEGGVGKTSVIQQLQAIFDDNNPFRENQSATNLVLFSTLQTSHHDFIQKKSIQCNWNVYDFGGQEIFNFVHPLFNYSDHSLILLVFKALPEVSPYLFEQQLKYIRQLHSNNTILVVFTHSNEDQSLSSGSSSGVAGKVDDSDVFARIGKKYNIYQNKIWRISNRYRYGISELYDCLCQLSFEDNIGWVESDTIKELSNYLNELSTMNCIQPINELLQNENIIQIYTKGMMFPSSQGNEKNRVDLRSNYASYLLKYDVLLLQSSGSLFIFERNNGEIILFLRQYLLIDVLQNIFGFDNQNKIQLKNGIIYLNKLLEFLRKLLERYYGKLPFSGTPLILSPRLYASAQEAFNSLSSKGDSASITEQDREYIRLKEQSTVLLDFLEKLSLCHKITIQDKKAGFIPAVLFPSLLTKIYSPIRITPSTSSSRQLIRHFYFELPNLHESDHLSSTNDNLPKENINYSSTDLYSSAKSIEETHEFHQKILDFVFPRLLINLWEYILDLKYCGKHEFIVHGDDDEIREKNKLKLTVGNKNDKGEIEYCDNFVIISRENSSIKLYPYGNCYSIISQIYQHINHLFHLFVSQCKVSTNQLFVDDTQLNELLKFEFLCPNCSDSGASFSVTKFNPKQNKQMKDMNKLLEWLCQKHNCPHCEKFQICQFELLEDPSDLLKVYMMCKYFYKEKEQHLIDTRTLQVYSNIDEISLGFSGGISSSNVLSAADEKFEPIANFIGEYIHFPLHEQTSLEIRNFIRNYKDFSQQDFILHKLIGRGCEGAVYLCSLSESIVQSVNCRYFALKINATSDLNSKTREEILQELKDKHQFFIQRKLEYFYTNIHSPSSSNRIGYRKGCRFNCPLLTTFISYIDLPAFEKINTNPPIDNSYAIFELMDLFTGSLHDLSSFIISTFHDLLFRLIMFLQVCKGLEELNNCGIIHRDLKLENIIYQKETSWVCITDLGLSIPVSNPDDMTHTFLPNQTLWGAPITKPPEIPPSITEPTSVPLDKADVYSLGYCLHSFIISKLTIPNDTSSSNIYTTFALNNSTSTSNDSYKMAFFQRYLIAFKVCMEKAYKERLSIFEANLFLEYLIFANMHKILLNSILPQLIQFNECSQPDLQSEIELNEKIDKTILSYKNSWIFSQFQNGKFFTVAEMLSYEFALFTLSSESVLKFVRLCQTLGLSVNDVYCIVNIFDQP